jgi:hypothetical protein
VTRREVAAHIKQFELETETRAIDALEKPGETLSPQQVTAISEIRKRRAQARYLRSYAKTGNITTACRRAKISRPTLYRWRDTDQKFAKLEAEAVEQANDMLVREARRRAERGWLEPVYQRGVQVGTIRKYSDALMITLLKGHRPEVYKDRVDVDSRVRHGALIDSQTSTDDELRARIAQALQLLGTTPAEALALPSPVQEPDVLPAEDDDQAGDADQDDGP